MNRNIYLIGMLLAASVASGPAFAESARTACDRACLTTYNAKTARVQSKLKECRKDFSTPRPPCDAAQLTEDYALATYRQCERKCEKLTIAPPS
jgi:hypothetical protein